MECTCINRAGESPISIIISAVALLVSVIAIVIEKRDSRTQLRLGFFNDHLHLIDDFGIFMRGSELVLYFSFLSLSCNSVIALSSTQVQSVLL